MDSRISWDTMFMEICKIISKRSTCVKIQTAAVIVNEDNNIISIGYNGVPSNMIHCTDYWNTIATFEQVSLDDLLKNESFRTRHYEWSQQNELHAEMNALIHCHSHPKKCKLYTLYSPCIHCSKYIISSSMIKEVIYMYPYTRDLNTSILLLESNDIKINPYNETIFSNKTISL